MADITQLSILKQGSAVWNSWRKQNPTVEVDLSKANLSNYDLSNTDLHSVNLLEATLFKVNLTHAILDNSNLRYANLSEAILVGTSLKQANLLEAILKHCCFEGANLKEADLEGADLSRANLKQACLDMARLENAYLKEANLSKALCEKTNLIRANLEKAILSGADFTNSDFSFSVLDKAIMKGVFLRNAKLEGAKLRGVDLESGKLSHASLERANFTEAMMRGIDCRNASLARAILKKANLMKGNLEDADVQNADLEDANLEKANLVETRLNGANLRGASLISCNLTLAQLRGANFTEANLDHANLSASQALNSIFHRCHLTGACIKDWNINSLTEFQDVESDYVFRDHDLKQSQFINRLPVNSERIFKPGEFEEWIKIQGEALKTIDLTFTDGIDWQTFFQSLQRVRQQYPNENVGLQAIEKKGSAFVIRLETTPDAPQAAIESTAKELYETQLQLSKAQENNNLIHASNDLLKDLLGDLSKLSLELKSGADSNISSPEAISEVHHNRQLIERLLSELFELRKDFSSNQAKTIESLFELQSQNPKALPQVTVKSNHIMAFLAWFQNGQAIIAIVALIIGAGSTYWIPKMFPNGFPPVKTEAEVESLSIPQP